MLDAQPESVVAEVWYRFTDVAYSTGYCEFTDRSTGSMIKIELTEHEVVRRTPKGAWINRGSGAWGSMHGELRFVLLSATKRFAYPTKAEAMASFLARKKAQARIYRARMERALRAINEAAHVEL